MTQHSKIVSVVVAIFAVSAALLGLAVNVRATPHTVDGDVGPVTANPADSATTRLYPFENGAAAIVTAAMAPSNGVDPASYSADVGSVWDPLDTGAFIGQTAIAVIETVRGVNGWLGSNFTASTDGVMTNLNFDTLPSVNMEAFPTLAAAPGVDNVNVTWTALIDPMANAIEYTVEDTLGTPLGQVNHLSGAALYFNHSSLAPGTYCYRISVDYRRDNTGTTYTGNARSEPICEVVSAPPLIPPHILSTTPVDGALGVVLTQSIIGTFDEAMLTGSVTVETSPTTTFTTPYTWTGGNTQLTASHAAPFLQCRTYTAWINGTDVDSNPIDPGPPSVANPWTFTTTCPSPQVITTTPVAATINVPLTQAIIVDFSKPMNTGGTTVQTSPPSTLTLVWSNLDQTVTASHAANFIDCEPYTVWVNGTDTFGNPLIGGPVPNPFPFTTTCIPPQVASTTPVNGAGNVATNANILVTFSEAMNQGATSIQSSPPVNFVPVNWNGPSTQMTALHLLPFQNCTTYWIYINGTDVDGNNLVPGPVNEPWFFSTACPVPYIVSTDPADGAGNVPVNSVITIVFSEPMQTSTCGVGNFTFAPSVTYTTSWNATNEIVTITPSGLLAPTTNYQVTVSGCQDVDGNGLSNIGAQNPWTFTTETITRPTVGVTAPLGGESFSGNSAQSISFGLADDLAVSLLTVYVNYTYNAGANSGVAFGPLPGYAATNTLSWPTPCINATDVIVNVTAVDQSGESGWDESNTFEIDCAAPTVSSTTPGNTATGVATNVDVRVVFNETMNETTTEAAATAPFSPAVTGITASLSVDGRTLVISHTGAFSPMTVYTVTIDSTAEDDTTPGNAMAADYVFTFTTGARTPGVPTGLAQTGLTSTGVTISWSAPTTYTNADPIPSTVAITYTLYRAANATGAGTQVQTGITAISYTDSGLTAGTSYWYYVTATAEGQTSGESQRLPVTTLAQPLPPDNTMLVVGGILAVVIVLLLLMFLLKRRKKPEEEVPPTEGEAPPPEGEAPPPEGEAPLPEGEMPPPEGAAPSPEGSFPEPEAGMPPLEPAGEAPLLGAEAAAPTKPCPSCGTEVPAEAIECFKCGATL